jgi:hypothetical protein
MGMHTMGHLLFASGEIFLTKRAIQAFERNNVDYRDYLVQHCSGCWGEVGNYSEIKLSETEIQKGCMEDAGKLNVLLLKRKENGSIMSRYKLSDSTKIWIITVRDFCRNKHYTTILLPSEY